jgi:hypothetical protein
MDCMSELKAMGLVGVAAFVLFVPVAVGLLMLGSGGETLALALVLFAVLTSIALTKVIKHYEARDARREREEILLSR